jgi:hypothetical protein
MARRTPKSIGIQIQLTSAGISYQEDDIVVVVIVVVVLVVVSPSGIPATTALTDARTLRIARLLGFQCPNSRHHFTLPLQNVL